MWQRPEERKRRQELASLGKGDKEAVKEAMVERRKEWKEQREEATHAALIRRIEVGYPKPPQYMSYEPRIPKPPPVSVDVVAATQEKVERIKALARVQPNVSPAAILRELGV